jgi:hypothetical protein
MCCREEQRRMLDAKAALAVDALSMISMARGI